MDYRTTMWKDSIFAENTIKGNINLSILKMYPFPQTEVTGGRKRRREEEEEKKRRRRGGGERAVLAVQHNVTHHINWILHKNVLPLTNAHTHAKQSWNK